jgi:hypothetical protein
MYSIYYLLYGSSFKFIVALKFFCNIFDPRFKDFHRLNISESVLCTRVHGRFFKNSVLLSLYYVLPPCTGKRVSGYSEEFTQDKSMESESKTFKFSFYFFNFLSIR